MFTRTAIAPLEYTRTLWMRSWVGLTMLFLYAPLIVLMVFSFNDSKRNVVWKGFTLKYYEKALNNDSLVEAMVNSLTIAFFATIISLIIGTLAAVMLWRFRFPFKGLVEGTMSLPIIVPEICLGVAFLIFFICALAELNRAPFDLPECESELVGGYHTEYSSMKLGLYLFAEYTSMFVSSAIMSILFFGGYNFPGMSHFSGNTLAILGIAAFAIKIFIFIFVIMWIRWTIPRFRFDQLMHLGWKSLLPLSLINLLITGIVIAYQNGWF
jgi:formate hydrogenlyase subunit 4